MRQRRLDPRPSLLASSSGSTRGSTRPARTNGRKPGNTGQVHANDLQHRCRRPCLWHGALRHLHRPFGDDGADAGRQPGAWGLRDDRRLYRLLCGARPRACLWDRGAAGRRRHHPHRHSHRTLPLPPHLRPAGADAGADDHRHHLLRHRHRQLRLRPDAEDHSDAGCAARARQPRLPHRLGPPALRHRLRRRRGARPLVLHRTHRLRREVARGRRQCGNGRGPRR